MKSLKTIPRGGPKQARGLARKGSCSQVWPCFVRYSKATLAASPLVQQVSQLGYCWGGPEEGPSQHQGLHHADRAATTGTPPAANCPINPHTFNSVSCLHRFSNSHLGEPRCARSCRFREQTQHRGHAAHKLTREQQVKQ